MMRNKEQKRIIEHKEAWKVWYDKAKKEDVEKTLALPFFDYKIFEIITGISKKMIDKKLKQ